MIVLDAQPVIALFNDEPAAAQVEALLRGDDEAALTMLGVVEVIYYLVRFMAVPDEEAALDVAQLRMPPPLELNAGIATQAGLLRARHYHRRDRALSLADCIAAETARYFEAPLATADPALLATCAAERIAVMALPDSNGVVWTGDRGGGGL